MEKLKSREIFIKACSEIAGQLQEYGFKPTQKWQTLKKLSADKDMIFEISFQSIHYNNNASIEICPWIFYLFKTICEICAEKCRRTYF